MISSTRFTYATLATVLLCLAGCNGTPEIREAAHLYKGRKYLDKGDLRAASIEFKIASQNMPKDAEPVFELARTYLRGGAAELAVEALQRAVKLNPKHAEAQFQLALLKAGATKPELLREAKDVLVERVSSKPKDAEALGALALTEAKLGEKDEALRHLLAFAATNPASLRPAELTIAVYLSQGNAAIALEFASRIASGVPQSPAAAVLQAQVLQAVNDNTRADAEIARALKLKPDFSAALLLRINRQLRTQDVKGAEETARALSRLGDQQFWPAYARLLFAAGRADEGAAEYDRVLKEHGNPADLRNDLAGLLAGAGRAGQASAVVEGTLKDHPKDRGALLQRVVLSLDGGRADDAATDIRTLRELKVSTAQLSFQEARLYALRGDKVKEGDLLTESLKLNPRFLQARLDLAKLLTDSGKGRTALVLLDEASPAEQASPEFLFARNLALISAGEFDKAREGVDAGLKLGRSPGFLYQDAALREQKKDTAGARKSIEAGLQLVPADPSGWLLLAGTMRRQGEFPKYLTRLKEAVAKNQSATALQKLLADQLAASGDVPGARAALEAARASGGARSADPAIATIDIQGGNLPAAKQRLQELVKTSDSAQARLLLADVAIKQGATDVAIQHYTEALKQEPSNWVAINNLAGLLTDKGRLEDAVFWAKKAQALAPENPVILDTLGWAYFRQGNYQAAIPLLDKSVRTADRPTAHYHLAAALMKAGDRSRAKREFEEGVKQDPKSAARAEVGPLFQ